jgi:hypothetical protein
LRGPVMGGGLIESGSSDGLPWVFFLQVRFTIGHLNALRENALSGDESSSAARRRHSSRRTHLRRPVRAWASFRRWITLPWIHNSFRGEGWSRNVYRPCVAVLCLARCGPRTRKRGREADRTYRVLRDSSGPRAVSADTGTNPPATALRAPKTGRRTYSKQKIQNTVDRGKTASSRGGWFRRRRASGAGTATKRARPALGQRLGPTNHTARRGCRLARLNGVGVESLAR